MAILRVPSEFSTIQRAIDFASAGDLILVANGVYHEALLVSQKNHIKILAENEHKATLDGRRQLEWGINITGSSGIEFNGFQVRNYIAAGVRIDQGNYNRIINNKIREIRSEEEFIGDGILLLQTEGNLVWRNNVKGVSADGIQVGPNGSTGNWIVENKVKKCGDDGIDIYSEDERNNALIDNKIEKNNNQGIENWGINTLILNNKVKENQNVGVGLNRGESSVALKNKIKKNEFDGIHVDTINNFIAANKLKKNGGSGIQTHFIELEDGTIIAGHLNMIQGNKIKKNRDNGIRLDTNNNYVFRNSFRKNTPLDIDDNGENNVFLQNRCRNSDPPGLCRF